MINNKIKYDKDPPGCKTRNLSTLQTFADLDPKSQRENKSESLWEKVDARNHKIPLIHDAVLRPFRSRYALTVRLGSTTFSLRDGYAIVMVRTHQERIAIFPVHTRFVNEDHIRSHKVQDPLLLRPYHCSIVPTSLSPT